MVAAMDPLQTGEHFPPQWNAGWIERRRQIESLRLGLHGHAESRGRQPVHYRTLKWGLKAAGLYARGYRNFIDLQKTSWQHFLKDWPASLDGFRILQISDLHIDLDPGLLPVILDRLQGMPCEMAVFTGDFWEGHAGDPRPAVRALQHIREAVGDPEWGVFGVLGNHDSLRIASMVEALGVRLLLNEATVPGEGPGRFALAGVDDAYIFRTEDVREAARQCPAGMPRILLSHSPQVAPLAARLGFSLMLSGHTHGGQICLPGGRSLVTMEEIPVPLFRGPWKLGGLKGYTTTGTGACHVPVRFNCPPEIVLHVIRRAV